MAIRSLIYRRHCNLFQAPSGTHQPRPKGTYSSPQFRSYIQIKKMPILHENNRLPMTRYSISTPRARVTQYGRPTRAEGTDKQHQTRIYFEVMQHIPKNWSQLRTPCNATERQAKNQSTAFRTLNENELASMNLLKNPLISLPVLTLPNTTVHLTLNTDACVIQISCVLLQQKIVRHNEM